MSKPLTEYHFPADLKEMNEAQLELLSYEIREFLLEKVSKTGGHLASNLGIVELTIALHKVFDSPKDKLLWDVGHQSYVHKILTGRAGEFDHLRQMGGISGFPKIKESIHDMFDTGHSSTSVSAAAGMAAARDIRKENYEVIAVIGDGSMTGGMAFEALNNVGASKSKVIVVLNDNGMSISRNIGGLSQHLSKLRTSKGYMRFKNAVKQSVNRIPLIGGELYTDLSHAKDRLKYALLSGGVIFEELGFTYLGPVNGHNLSELIEVLETAKKISGPVFVHIITQKGKGYRNAEQNPDKFHGIAPFDAETGSLLSPQNTSYSAVFGDEVLKLARQDEHIAAITAAMCDATGLSRFSQKFPERFFDVGIAEAHGVTFAAGLARSGMHPVVAIYSSFLQRAYDQILEDVCLMKLPVVFAVDRAGIVGADGETHHGLFDLSYMLPMPNMTILAPYGQDQMRAALQYALAQSGPVAIRYPRGECPEIPIGSDTFFSGKNVRLYSGRDVDIWAVGRMTETACRIRTLLAEKGIDAGIVDVIRVKPMELSCREDPDRPVVTIEDNVLTGGFGQAFAAAGYCHRVLSLGWPDSFIEHGSCGELEEKYGLSAEAAAERIGEYLERKA